MSRKLRVAICALSQTLDAPTGLLGYFAQLARFLPRVDPATEYHFVTSAALRDWIGGDSSGAILHEMGWDDRHRPLRLLSEHFLLGWWLKRHAIDILYMANAGVSPLLLPREIKLVQGIFAFHQFGNAEASPARRLYRRLFFDRTIARASRIVLNSAYSAGLLTRYAADGAGKSRVIPHGIDPALFHAGPVSAADVDALAERRIVPPYLLFVSQMYPYKNVETAVDGFGRFIAAAGSDHRLVLVGRFDRLFSAGESYRRQLIDIAGRHEVADRLIFIDALPVELLRAAYRGAHAYLQPSLAETFGKTSLEAMACSCPVVAAAAAATPEIVGDAALLFPPKDAAACAEALLRLGREPALGATLVGLGLARARHATFETEAAALASLFREVGSS